MEGRGFVVKNTFLNLATDAERLELQRSQTDVHQGPAGILGNFDDELDSGEEGDAGEEQFQLPDLYRMSTVQGYEADEEAKQLGGLEQEFQFTNGYAGENIPEQPKQDAPFALPMNHPNFVVDSMCQSPMLVPPSGGMPLGSCFVQLPIFPLSLQPGQQIYVPPFARWPTPLPTPNPAEEVQLPDISHLRVGRESDVSCRPTSQDMSLIQSGPYPPFPEPASQDPLPDITSIPEISQIPRNDQPGTFYCTLQPPPTDPNQPIIDPSACASNQPLIGAGGDAPRPLVLERHFSVTRPDKLVIRWAVDARKLNSSDKEAVSPGFDVQFARSVTFKMVIRPKAVHDMRGGGAFKKSKGIGYVELRCLEKVEPEIQPRMHFSICVGSGLKGESPRQNSHDFSERAVCGLPAGQQEWNFTKHVDPETQTFVVKLEIILNPANS